LFNNKTELTLCQSRKV